MINHLNSHIGAYKGNIIYDFDNEILMNWYPQRIIDLSKKSKSILELGLGHGYTANIFSQNFKRHVVLDGSSAVIENFRKNFPDFKAEIIETYFEKFETSEKFDVIVLGFILEHVDDPHEIITRYGKFLSESGKMFIAVPNAEVLNRRLGHLADMLPDMQELSENDLLLGHKRYYTVESLTNEITKAGFYLKKLEGIYLKPFTTRQILSLDLDKKFIQSLCKVGIDYPELCCGILAEINIAD
jgi:2-polyprenyl-3-methyl-5-hydroxy-6-metoxy-1,4-benzoquinol methylase